MKISLTNIFQKMFLFDGYHQILFGLYGNKMVNGSTTGHLFSMWCMLCLQCLQCLQCG